VARNTCGEQVRGQVVRHGRTVSHLSSVRTDEPGMLPVTAVGQFFTMQLTRPDLVLEGR
jgi:hypothetical protein